MNRTCKLFALLILIMLLLLGCGIGKTKTLFVTKTNAGLELSTTPPTIALDIGRVEGVLAPQFENGKKLPVMASFKFETSGAFSPNVGSAFATGDAAITMAALYGDDTPESNWKSRITKVKDPTSGTNSVLHLNGKPNPGRWLPLPDTKWLNWMNPELQYQKNDVRPVFFGTDTSLGVKVAWSGMTGQFPDTARFGYNRKELALVPISMEEKVQATQGGGLKRSYDMKMSSLLATLDSGVEVDGTPALDSTYIQYFATGNAATLLSLQREVRAAMLQRLDPNSKIYQERFGRKLEGEAKTVAFVLLRPIYIELNKMISTDPNAKLLVDGMDNIDPIQLAIDFKEYNFASATHILSIIPSTAFPLTQSFHHVLDYYTMLVNSIGMLSKAITYPDLKDPAGQVIQQPKRDELMKEVKTMIQKRDKFEADVLANPVIAEAVDYFFN